MNLLLNFSSFTSKYTGSGLACLDKPDLWGEITTGFILTALNEQEQTPISSSYSTQIYKATAMFVCLGEISFGAESTAYD